MIATQKELIQTFATLPPEQGYFILKRGDIRL